MITKQLSQTIINKEIFQPIISIKFIINILKTLGAFPFGNEYEYHKKLIGKIFTIILLSVVFILFCFTAIPTSDVKRINLLVNFFVYLSLYLNLATILINSLVKRSNILQLMSNFLKIDQELNKFASLIKQFQYLRLP